MCSIDSLYWHKLWKIKTTPIMQERHVETRTRTNCGQRMLRRFCVCIVDLFKHQAVILGDSCHLRGRFSQARAPATIVGRILEPGHATFLQIIYRLE